MNRFICFIIGCMLCFVSVAQEKTVVSDTVTEKLDTVPKKDILRVHKKISRLSTDNDTVHLSFYKEIYLQNFFTGLFFKRISDNVLNLPSSDYKDRFLKCENCEISRYSVKKKLSGCTCLSDLYLVVAPEDREVTLETTSKTGEQLSVIDLSLSPVVTFYIKINDTSFKYHPSFSFPPINEQDRVCFYATAKGEKIKIVRHCIEFLDGIGGCMRDWVDSNELDMRQKRRIANASRPVSFYFLIKYEDKEGKEWSQILIFQSNGN